MTEKRYKHMCNDFGKFTIHSIFDTQTNECYGDDNYQKIVDRLNNQDQRIKELEKANKDYDDAINETSDILREAYEHGVSNPYLKRIGKVKVENR